VARRERTRRHQRHGQHGHPDQAPRSHVQQLPQRPAGPDPRHRASRPESRLVQRQDRHDDLVDHQDPQIRDPQAAHARLRVLQHPAGPQNRPGRPRHHRRPARRRGPRADRPAPRRVRRRRPAPDHGRIRRNGAAERSRRRPDDLRAGPQVPHPRIRHRRPPQRLRRLRDRPGHRPVRVRRLHLIPARLHQQHDRRDEEAAQGRTAAGVASHDRQHQLAARRRHRPVGRPGRAGPRHAPPLALPGPRRAVPDANRIRRQPERDQPVGLRTPDLPDPHPPRLAGLGPGAPR
jgi:hypothetical protein